MKLGVIARADDRGLGNQTWEVVRHLRPDRVLVVRSPSSERQGFAPHLDRFPGATVVTDHAGVLDRDTVMGWLDGLDVVYSAECLYDVRLADWANLLGVATVIHGNPEFHRPDDVEPTVWWSATDWRLEHMPEGTRVVPMPVPLDRWPTVDPYASRVLHIGGRPASGDRNGTEIVLEVAALLPEMQFTITTQGEQFGSNLPNVTYVRHSGDYWRMYDDHAVLLLPRRYAGLCLPVIEACGAGLAPVMLDMVPNRSWPCEFVEALRHANVRTPAGTIQAMRGDPAQLARTLTTMDVVAARTRARDWAEENSWDQLEGLWRSELGAAAEQAQERKRRRSNLTVEVIVPTYLASSHHRRDAWAYCRGWWERHGYQVTEAPGGDPWVKADAVNLAVGASTADILVIADADVFCDGITEAIAHVADEGGWAIPHTHVHRIADDATADFLSGQPLRLQRTEQDPYRGIAGGGIVVLERPTYERIPLDRRFVGWGGEDHSWGLALETLVGRPWRGDAPLVHLWHPPQERREQGRTRRMGSVDNENLRREYLQARGNPRKMQSIVTEALSNVVR